MLRTFARFKLLMTFHRPDKREQDQSIDHMVRIGTLKSPGKPTKSDTTDSGPGNLVSYSRPWPNRSPRQNTLGGFSRRFSSNYKNSLLIQTAGVKQVGGTPLVLASQTGDAEGGRESVLDNSCSEVRNRHRTGTIPPASATQRVGVIIPGRSTMMIRLTKSILKSF